MAESCSSSNLNLDTMNRSSSNLSIKSNTTIDSTLSTTSNNRKRFGLFNKIGNGFQSVFRRFSRPHTSLTEMEIQVLITKSNFTREEILQWHEKFLRDCPHGYMTRKQFVSMYKSLCPKGDAERFARHVFRAFDLDRSNSVDFREFLIGLSVTSSISSPETKLKWAFEVFDIDGDNFLTRRECLEVIESIVRFNYSLQNEQQHQQQQLEQVILTAKRAMMRIFDTTIDIQGDQLTMSQFIQGCLKEDFIAQLLAADTTEQTSNETHN